MSQRISCYARKGDDGTAGRAIIAKTRFAAQTLASAANHLYYNESGSVAEMAADFGRCGFATANLFPYPSQNATQIPREVHLRLLA
jgi:hypothetical protein